MQESIKSTQDTQQTTNPIQRKLNKILENKIEHDKDLLDSLKSLSTFVPVNNIRTRRNLRSVIEKKSLLLNEQFLNAFKEVKDQLDELCSDIDCMTKCCDNMSSRLKHVKQETSQLLTKTSSLQAEKQDIDMKIRIAKSFNEKFQLSNEEISALSNNNDTHLHKDFFAVLERVQKIHSECKILLRTNQQTAGLEIMEQMSLNQEAAFERLYRWTQNETRVLCNETVEINNMLSQAMSVLRQRPILFKYTLDEYCNSRRNAVLKFFIDALTRGSGSTKPIELNSHDPLRYIGDMLACIHLITASEYEYLRSLFRKMSNEFDLESNIKTNLALIIEGVCRPFRIRVEQVLVSQQVTILFKISNILKFYQFTIGQRISDNSALIQTLEELNNLSHKMFLNTLSTYTSKLFDKIEQPSVNLSPSIELRKILSLIREIFDSYNTSVVSLSAKKEDYNQILDCVLDPLLQVCSLSAVRLSTIETSIYMINCMHEMHSLLSLYEYTNVKIEKLEAQIDAHMDTLINEQACFILNKTDLYEIYKTIQSHDVNTHGPLCDKLGMDSVAVKSAMIKFDTYLASPDKFIIPQSNMIMGASLRLKLKEKCARMLLDAYELVYKAITAQSNGYSHVETIVPRTPEQVLKLLF